MRRTVTANLTFSSQANRDAAASRIQNTLDGIPHSPRQNALSATGGMTYPTTTTLQLSVEIGEEADADTAASQIFAAITSGTRHTAGWVSVNKF